MEFTCNTLHSSFAAEASPVELRTLNHPKILGRIRAALDQYAVLVFRNQRFRDEELLTFGRCLDGQLHAQTSQAVLTQSRSGEDSLTNISNIGPNGEILAPNDRSRMASLANRLWHTDASFVSPPGRYSILSARVLPPVSADTEFADMRAAYDSLDAKTKASIDGLMVHHSIVHSREILGFEFTSEEKAKLKGADQPLVRKMRGGRRSLYLASHAQSIVNWPVAEGRLLIRDLIEHASQPRFVFRHKWQVGDLVIWDNRTTMHRATAFDDITYRRELCRVTTLDI